MPNFFKRAAKYANASANAKLEARADPRIQIEQAVEEAQKQHAALTRQAASVIGNVKQVEMKLGRQYEEAAKLKASAGQALKLADQARAAGDTVKATQMESTAQSFAAQLVGVEKNVADLTSLHAQAQTSSVAARQAVDDSATRLRSFLDQRSQLLTQLESAKMQESVAGSLESLSSLAPAGDTPSLEQVREKIEGRYAQASGRAELASGGFEARQLEVDRASIDGAAALRLEEIRASMATPTPALGASAAPAIGAGAPVEDAAEPAPAEESAGT